MSKRSKLHRSSSFALMNAVSNLFHFEDFAMEMIASGGYADIFKATHLESQEVMVIKKPKKKVNQPIMTRECEIMAHLSHPNVLKSCGVIIDNGALSIVTEFINGGTLQDYLKNDDNILPWSTRIKLAVDIADAMSYINQMGYFHRDLTSLNVLIRKDSNYICGVVSDFGLAAKIPKKGRVLPGVGTPFCRAPECIRGEYYDHKADVFSFGIILCEFILRCDYDPDNLPRTQNFGVDYMRIGEMVEDCPVSFLFLAFHCCQMDPDKRLTFEKVCLRLESTLLDYLNCGLNNEYDEYNVNKPWSSFNDLTNSSWLGQKYSISGLDLPSVTDSVPDCYENVGDMSPRELGKAMSLLDPHYTSHGLDFDSIFALMNITSSKSRTSLSSTNQQESNLNESTTSTNQNESNLDQSTTSTNQNEATLDQSEQSENIKIIDTYQRTTNSLPYTRAQLKALADRCLCKLPSDRNLLKQSNVHRRVPFRRLISRTLIHNMPNHGINFPRPIVNCKDHSQISEDSAVASVSHRQSTWYSKSKTFSQNLKRQSQGPSQDLEENLLRQFIHKRSSSSVYSSYDGQSEVDVDNDKFYRFMRRYLIACLKTKYPHVPRGRRILLTPESLKRMADARAMFKSIGNSKNPD